MISEIFLIMMIAHLIGDFYLQTDKMSRNKKKNKKSLLSHFGLYSLAGLVLFIPMLKSSLSWVSICYVAFIFFHIVIDLIKMTIEKKYTKKNWYRKSAIYITDQVLHIISIIIIASVFENNVDEFMTCSCIDNIFNTMGISINMALKLALIFLFVIKPVNISFREIFDLRKLKHSDDEKEKSNKSFGAVIGSMERTLIVILVLFQQYTAIGFVIAGKSVARFKDDLSIDYFIVGTFFSILSAIIPYFLIIQPWR